MANKQSPLTNRKLGFARKQLAIMIHHSKPNSSDTPAASCALEAGLVFLYQAYISMLAEIADAYRHNGEPITGLSHLKTVLSKRGLSPSELNTLEQLEIGPSWLSGLIEAQDLLLSVEAKDQFRVVAGDHDEPSLENKLQLVDAMAEQTMPDKFQSSVDAFAEILEEIREGFAEY